jgi:hypothetical protein
MIHVCYFRHALALDERRVKFLPEYAYGGRAIGNKSQDTDDDQATQIMDANASVYAQPTEKKTEALHNSRVIKKKLSPQRPQTLEVWFAGTHSDM